MDKELERIQGLLTTLRHERGQSPGMPRSQSRYADVDLYTIIDAIICRIDSMIPEPLPQRKWCDKCGAHGYHHFTCEYY